MNSNLPDNDIPVLTEVIAFDYESEFIAAVKAQFSKTASSSSPVSPLPAEESLEQLEKTLREKVLNQLLTRIDFILELRVRDSLADVLQTTVENLAKEIRQGLVHSLEEVIQIAVSQEISKIQSLNSKPPGNPPV